MKTVIVLAMHGAPPNDFPKPELMELFGLHTHLEHSNGPQRAAALRARAVQVWHGAASIQNPRSRPLFKTCEAGILTWPFAMPGHSTSPRYSSFWPYRSANLARNPGETNLPFSSLKPGWLRLEKISGSAL
jgi:hypothetical protein